MTCSRCGGVCGCTPAVRSAVGLRSNSGSALADELVENFGPAISDRNHEQAPPDSDHGCTRSSRPKFVVEQDRLEVDGGSNEEGCVVGRNLSPKAQDGSPESAHPEDIFSVAEGQPQADPSLLVESDESSWRREVSERLHRYHARRRPRAPRYPSLRLKFDSPAVNWEPPREGATLSQAAQPVSTPAAAMRHALATEYVEAAPALKNAIEPSVAETPMEAPRPRLLEAPAKIIEFPRTMYVPQSYLHDLAEPILDRPRILEAPEVVPPPPALGGMTIEQVERAAPERQPGIDMPLQSASTEQRVMATVIDGGIVCVAASVFAAIFYNITKSILSVREMAELSAGILLVFWAAYQYLFIVYSGTTPGLHALKLRLQQFDGKPADRRLRHWRVLGAVLSGISLGMGYAWHFLDEDGLCWHERVTKTHIACSK